MSTAQKLEKLARYRTIGARRSEEVYSLGNQLLSDGARGLGEQGTSWRYPV